MIIAFGHQRRRGKDTCAQFLETALKIKYPRIIVKRQALADALKNSCLSLYSWAGLQSGVYYENNPADKEKILPELGKSPRDIWIDYGNAVRQFVYINTFIAKVLYNYNPKTVMIITDLRYPNEAQMIKELGGKCIKVIRDSLPKSTDVADTALNGYSNWDVTIQNNGSLFELSHTIQEFAEGLDVRFQ